ncbi:MAG: 23S rRNA (adenine(2030)-N(6))-methyltransferase RlmJ [Gallionella sp.]
MKIYPGSPLVALKMMRPDDRLRLYELHPTDSDILLENFIDYDPQALTHQANGFGALKALLPPPPRRGLILIDPPYEEKQDYQRVVDSLKEGLKRFANGIYAVWYPQLQRDDARRLPEEMKTLPVKSWLHVALTVKAEGAEGIGMHGSGMFVLNPPWVLHGVLQEVMPYLAKHLAQDEHAHYTLEYHEN